MPDPTGDLFRFPDAPPARPPEFDAAFRRHFLELLVWRRDVRRFRPDPIPAELIRELISMARLAPSVGLSEPWRFVLVDEPARRRAVRENFLACNADALAAYSGERAERYAHLKLEGLDTAPVHVAVFVDPDPEQGHGLGRRTMPETVAYSAVMAIYTLWLAARTHRIGVGWVSILTPKKMVRDLAVPGAWRFIAYLCIGHPAEESSTPALSRSGWERRSDPSIFILQR